MVEPGYEKALGAALADDLRAPEVAAGRLFVVPGGPRYRHPAYLVHPLDSDSPVLAGAVAALRELAADLG